MINHVVLMKFKPGASQADIEDLEKSLDDLPNKIIEIHSYEFGRDLVRSDRSYDFALVSLFANLQTLEQYRNHPQHLMVVQKIRRLCDDIVTEDKKLCSRVVGVLKELTANGSPAIKNRGQKLLKKLPASY